MGNSPAEYSGVTIDAIGVLKAAGKLLEKIAHAREAMRLDDGNHATVGTGACRSQNGGDLDGVMAVVIIDGDAVPPARELEAALDAGKRRHGGANGPIGNTSFAGSGDGGQRI